jgi:hypothetical protein
VAVFSMEMSREQLAFRMISSIGRVDQGHMRTGMFGDEDWARINSAIAQMKTAPLYIDDSGALTPSEVRARARRLARERKDGLGLIVIDYLQLMQVAGTKENRATEISEISRSLKALAKELKVPVIALSQLNRAVEQRVDKKPVMSDLRESGAIEQDADLIMLIYREEVYEPDTARKGIADIIIAKQRNGPTGEVHLTLLGKYTRFEISRRAVTAATATESPRLGVESVPSPMPRPCAWPSRGARACRRCARDGGHQGERLRSRRAAVGKALAEAISSQSRSSTSLAQGAGLTNRVLLLEGVFARAAGAGGPTAIQADGALSRATGLLDGFAGGEPIRAWIKVDTGMNRLSFRVEEFAAAHARLAAIRGRFATGAGRTPGERQRSHRCQDCTTGQTVQR